MSVCSKHVRVRISQWLSQTAATGEARRGRGKNSSGAGGALCLSQQWMERLPLLRFHRLRPPLSSLSPFSLPAEREGEGDCMPQKGERERGREGAADAPTPVAGRSCLLRQKLVVIYQEVFKVAKKEVTIII